MFKMYPFLITIFRKIQPNLVSSFRKCIPDLIQIFKNDLLIPSSQGIFSASSPGYSKLPATCRLLIHSLVHRALVIFTNVFALFTQTFKDRKWLGAVNYRKGEIEYPLSPRWKEKLPSYDVGFRCWLSFSRSRLISVYHQIRTSWQVDRA